MKREVRCSFCDLNRSLHYMYYASTERTDFFPCTVMAFVTVVEGIDDLLHLADPPLNYKACVTEATAVETPESWIPSFVPRLSLT